MPTITLRTNGPDQAVLSAIYEYVSNKYKKLDITTNEQTITVHKKVMWQHQTTSFTVSGNVLTAESDVADAITRMNNVVGTMAKQNMIDGRGWHEAVAKSQMNKNLNLGDMLRVFQELQDHETIHAVTVGVEDKKRQVIVCTNSRLLLVEAGLVGKGCKTIALDKVSSVSTKQGMVLAEMKFTTSNGEIEIDNVIQGDEEMFAGVVRQLMDAPAAQEPSAPAQAGGVDTDQLQKLADLHAQGILTDDEFAAAKAKALGL